MKEGKKINHERRNESREQTGIAQEHLRKQQDKEKNKTTSNYEEQEGDETADESGQ